MSTNPFRQTQQSQNSSNTTSQFGPLLGHPDGGGVVSKDLSINTKVPPSSLDRHVSFASPPVDSTIPAASYPSSPESARSPPLVYSQYILASTPDYRTALQSDPFQDLEQDNRDDYSTRQALQNTRNNAIFEQNTPAAYQQSSVQNTLNRFAPTPRVPPPGPGKDAKPMHNSPRQSMDVDAFKRLLLTGDSGQSTSTPHTLPDLQSAAKGLSGNGPSTSSAPMSQNLIHDSNVLVPEETVKRTGEPDLSPANKQHPPPAPAPRRGKSIKSKGNISIGSTNGGTETGPSLDTDQMSSKFSSSKRPPTPPLARRQSHKTSSSKGEDASPSSTSHLDLQAIIADSQPPKGPPPPPIRRQGTNSEQRRVSHDLAPTVEEPEPEQSIPYVSSRKSSDAPSMPPLPPRSRNSSDTSRRTSLTPMNPPPVPPPRRGRGSSRSSIDSFRPNLASLTGEENNPINKPAQSSQQGKDLNTLNPSSASSILAELADLQREVDTARRGA